MLGRALGAPRDPLIDFHPVTLDWVPTRRKLFRLKLPGSLGEAQQRTCQYPGKVELTDEDSEFAVEAGRRLEQAFALCSFASQLAGKAAQ